jgi:2-polyprenyl-3-methyl-5-hydroxy-6-metoxy-1,4-benzoquinol methylase
MQRDQTESTRWKDEAAFFDQEAEAAMSRIQAVHPRTIDRYGRLKRRRFNKEFRFRVIGPLAGKTVLDVGCGDGINAVNFAKLGARVTGIDISPKAIELAERRAEVDHVSDAVRMVCSPLELAELPPASFDVIWGEAVLHHLIHDLDDVMRRLVRWAKPGAVVVFGEPVNLSPALRKLRMMLPIHTDVTPDERPLEQAELDIVGRHLPDMRIRYFSVVDRLSRFVLSNHNYELSSAPRRALSSIMNTIDYGLLSVPALHWLAGTCVIYGHAPGPKR